MSPTVLFTTDRPDFYLIDQIYDPLTNPTGTVIPRPGSLVLDVSNRGLLQRVISVDEDTLAVTYGPVFTSLLRPIPTEDDDSTDVSVIDYGNSRFRLFFDKSVTPTKLSIDTKVLVVGDDARDYELMRYDSTLQQYIPISLYYDLDGVFRGTRVPFMHVDSGSRLKITDCHTSMPINDDEVYWMFIYDYSGSQCGSIKLFAKAGLVNNALEDDLLIEDFRITATQYENGELFLFPDQDPDSLMIAPEIVYNNGETRLITIDNEICHLYGLEGFTASYPGQTVEVMVKYFLAPTQQAVSDKLIVNGSVRCLVERATLVVRDPGTNDYRMKISVIPRYVFNVDRYVLTFMLYVIGDTQVRDVTQFVTVSPTFDGRLMGVEQELTLSLRIRDIFPGAISDYVYQQPVLIKLAPYSFIERYVIRDTVGDTYGVYGTDSPILPRPVLLYDDTISQYFVPSTKFRTLNMFLEAFYYKARPLYDTSWLSAPPAPTHFVIREATSGNLLLTSTPVESYAQTLNLLGLSAPGQLVGGVCIFEMLQLVQGTYQILYGVPVDVYAGTHS